MIEILKEDVCECTFEQINNQSNVNGSVLENCLNKKIASYPEMFKITLANENFILQNEPGKKYIISLDNLNSFLAGHQKYFINHCEPYYWYASRLRENILLSFRDNKVEETLKKLNKKINRKSNEDNLEYYLQRAKIYMATGLYDDAKNDLKQILRQKSDHQEALYYLAWSYELSLDYLVAKNLYIKLIKNNNHFDAILGLECVNRKLVEKYDMDDKNTLVIDESASDEKVSVKPEKRVEVPPIPRSCYGVKGNEKIKQCFSSHFKQYIVSNFQPVIDTYNFDSGVYRIYTRFKVSNKGFITDVQVKYNGEDPYIINEVTRIISSFPPLKPGTINGRPVGVLYSFPLAFEIHNKE